MQRFKQGQKLIIVILSLMLMLIAVFSCLNIVTINNKEDAIQANNTRGTGVFDFVDCKDNKQGFDAKFLTEDQYDSYKYFVINNTAGWNSFVASVNNFRTFTNKVVYLSCNIFGVKSPVGFNYNNASECVFDGTFDGGGHTISNVKIEIQNTKNYTITNDGGGLFALLGPHAVITGLRINGATLTSIKAEENHGESGNLGALAGRVMPGATIQYCMVENVEATITKSEVDGIIYKTGPGTNSYVGGLIGLIAWYNIDPDNSFENVANTEVTIKDCVIKNFKVNEEMTGFKGGKLIVGGISGYSCKIDHVLVIPADDNNVTRGYAFHPGNNVTSTYCTSSTGKVFEEYRYQDPWYYNSPYNDGYSMLTMFVDLVTVNFKSENEFWGTVSVSSIKIPREALERYEESEAEFDKDRYKYFDPYDISPFNIPEIFAEPKEGYVFSKWVQDDAFNYRAFFGAEWYNFKFQKIKGVYAPKCWHSTGVTVTYEDIGFHYLDNVTCEIESEIVGGVLKTIITITNSAYYVSYAVDGKYTIDTTGMEEYLNGGVVKNLENGNTYIITPTIKLKEYGVQIK